MDFGNQRYYRDSGAIPFLGSLITLVAGIGTGLVLGGIYGFAAHHVPYIILLIFGAMIVAFGTGFAVSHASVAGNIRNPWFTRVVGLVSGITAVYAEWVGWLYAALKIVIVQPDLVFTFVRVFAAAADNSILMYILWGGEALAIVGIVTAMAGSREVPFCEECNQWAVPYEDCTLLAIPEDVNKLRLDLENERYEVLDDLRTGFDDSNCLRATIYQCPCEGEENYLTLKQVVIVMDSDGDENRDETVLVQRLWIPDPVVESLLEPVDQPDRPEMSPLEEDDEEPFDDVEEDEDDDLFERD